MSCFVVVIAVKSKITLMSLRSWIAFKLGRIYLIYDLVLRNEGFFCTELILNNLKLDVKNWYFYIK